MKKIVCIILALCCVASLSACTGRSTENALSNSSASLSEQEISSGEYIWLNSVSNEYPLAAGAEVRFAAVSNDRIFFAGVKGASPMLSVCNIKNGSAATISTPTAIPIESTEPDEQYIYGLTSGNDGYFYVLMGELPDIYTYVDENNESRQNPDYQGRYSIIRFSADGTRMGKTQFQLSPIEDVVGAKCLYGLVCGDEGELVAWGSSEVDLVKMDSGLVNRVVAKANSIDTVSVYDGKVVVLSGINAESKCMLVDGETGNLSVLVEGSKAYTSVSSCHSYSGRLLVNDYSVLGEYDPVSGSVEKLFNWTECDGLEGGSVKQVLEIDGNFFLIVYWHDDTVTFLRRSYINDSRKVLELACYPGISRSMAKIVGGFNSSNPDYRVEYTDYKEQNQLQVKLSSSEVPDILLTDGTINTSSNLFADLYPWIDQSNAIQRSSFIHALPKALAINDELHEIWTAFEMNTFIARSADAQYSPLTIEDYNNIAVIRGEEYTVFENWVTRNELLKWIASISTGQYVDRNTGKCSFDDPTFAQLLAWCKSLPQTSTNPEDNLSTSLLFPQYIENTSVIQTWTDLLGGSIEYVGFPGVDGCGSYLSPSFMSTLAMPKGENMEGAWSFIEYALTATATRNMEADAFSMVFPTLAKPLDQLLRRNLDNISAEKFMAEVESTDLVLTHYDNIMRDIIMDSCSAYFAGDKSLEETVNIIQSRTNVYIQEKFG